MKLEKDSVISHYRILSAIGKGGMGEVYLAQDTKLNRKVAIKFLNEELSRDAEKLNRFIQEAQATSALNHPNILTVHGIDSFENTHFIATEFIDGETLREVIAKKESIPLKQILKIGTQAAEAVSAAHKAGIVHRDIKPENIMIREDGYVKVLDFGLAKLTERTKAEHNISLEGDTRALVKTNPGMVMGTVSYMSPEQARGKDTDARTDVWSLGVVLYEMFAGKPPFTGETINHTIVSILETEPKLLENVPDELQRIVRKTLTKDREMRYQSAKDLLIDLTNLIRTLEIQGELERSVVPDREVTHQVRGDETKIYTDPTIDDTKSGTVNPTQNITTSSSLEYAVTKALTNKSVTAIIGFVLLAIIASIVYFGFFADSTRQIESIAVMPFVNVSGNEDIEYLSDGMTETLISRLSSIPKLSVKASSTVFYYKGKNSSPKQLGEELGVNAVLLGKVNHRNDDLVIHLELVDTKSLNAIWSESYNRRMSDLVGLQADIAGDVSNKLRFRLSGSEKEQVTRSDTPNSEAYQAYLKGRFFLDKRTGASIGKGVEFFQQAIQFDPNYAKAWSGLADAYMLLPNYTFSPDEAREFHASAMQPKALAAAQKAIELDPELAEAHTSLAFIFVTQWKFAESEKEFKHAITLNPKYANSHQWYSMLLSDLGRFDEAIAQAKIALSLEPLLYIANYRVGMALLTARRTSEAVEQFRKTAETFPDSPGAHQRLSIYLAMEGKIPEAIESCDRAIRLNGNVPMICLPRIYASQGKKQEVVKYFKSHPPANDSEKMQTALAYSIIDEKDKVFQILEGLYQERSPQASWFRAYPEFDNLRGDPRFKDLLGRVGLPE